MAVRHARPTDLAGIAPLLDRLRQHDHLRERSPGTFYRRGDAFLHFHVDGDTGAVLADLKQDGEWHRLAAGRPADWDVLLDMVSRAPG